MFSFPIKILSAMVFHIHLFQNYHGRPVQSKPLKKYKSLLIDKFKMTWNGQCIDWKFVFDIYWVSLNAFRKNLGYKGFFCLTASRLKRNTLQSFRYVLLTKKKKKKCVTYWSMFLILNCHISWPIKSEIASIFSVSSFCNVWFL